MVLIGVLGVQLDIRASGGEVLFAAREGTVSINFDVILNELHDCRKGRGVRGGVASGGSDDAEEDVGFGVGDAVEVFEFRYTGGGCGARGYCVLGVEEARNGVAIRRGTENEMRNVLTILPRRSVRLCI